MNRKAPRKPTAPTTKRVELAHVVEQSVTLLGQVVKLHDDLAKAGLDKAFPIGRQVTARHQELMQEWGRYAGTEEAVRVEQMAYMLGLYRRCRDAINQVQSSLQNLTRSRGNSIMMPSDGVEATFTMHPAQILAEIVKAKENWAYIDAHPQVVIARA